MSTSFEGSCISVLHLSWLQPLYLEELARAAFTSSIVPSGDAAARGATPDGGSAPAPKGVGATKRDGAKGQRSGRTSGYEQQESKTNNSNQNQSKD